MDKPLKNNNRRINKPFYFVGLRMCRSSRIKEDYHIDSYFSIWRNDEILDIYVLLNQAKRDIFNKLTFKNQFSSGILNFSEPQLKLTLHYFHTKEKDVLKNSYFNSKWFRGKDCRLMSLPVKCLVLSSKWRSKISTC